jgi:hypothetical protein
MQSSACRDADDDLDDGLRPGWAHVWWIIVLRRAIDRRLVWGTVWHRHDGRRWITDTSLVFDEH